MKLPGFLSKPRWQSKDAAVRRAAVVADSEPELLAHLPRLAREDADPLVRIAALKRIGEPSAIQRAAHDDADPEVRRQARALWFDLLSGAHASSPPLADRLRLLAAQDDAELIEHLARRSTDAALRAAALARTTRAALLFERALDDADPALRLRAVERIDDEAQLLRLAERARKSDKQVSRAARERVDALRLGRGDTAVLALRARTLCERAERMVRVPAGAEAEADIERQWLAVEPHVDDALRQRFQAARALLAASRLPRARPVDVPVGEDASNAGAATSDDGDRATSDAEPAPTAPDATATDSADTPAQAADTGAAETIVVAPLLAQARFAASLDDANAAQRKERERQRVIVERIAGALPALEQALDAGSIGQANVAKATIDHGRRELAAELPRALAAQIGAIEQRYAQLAHWQHWADDQRRMQLCEDIEALPAAGLHPDAVATRVREAQTEWTRLDAAEARQGARPSGLSRRFHAACRGALAPAQAYFRKRQELRQSHAQRITELVERVDAPAEGDPDWQRVIAQRREVIEALRDLDRVDPRERKALAQQMKTRLAALDARIEEHDADIERGKAALIREAEALAQPEMPRGAAAAARDLQQRWQRLGNGRRSRDQAQWKAFRAAIDAVFARLDAVRVERQARDVATREQAQALCDELETLVNGGRDLDAHRGDVARIVAAWNALESRDEAQQRRFDTLRDTVRAAAARRERDERRRRFDAWLQRYRLCRAAERGSDAGDALRAQWHAAAPTDIADARLSARFDAAANTETLDADGAADDDAQRDVLVQLELIAGEETPPEDRERRRAFQVARLSARMSAGAAAPQPADELAALLTRWTALAPATPALDERLQRAVTAVLDKLP